MSTFTTEELHVLQRFYAKHPARLIRQEEGIDPWPLVARHRALPKPEYEAVRRAVRVSFDN
jgi:hypothetical protein